MSYLAALQSFVVSSGDIRTNGIICMLGDIFTTIKSVMLRKCGLEGHLDVDMSRLSMLTDIDMVDNNLVSLDLSLFLLPRLERCFFVGNMNLTQPPLFEVDLGVGRLRKYAQCEKAQFDKLVLAIVGKEGVGKTVLTFRLMGRNNEAEQYLCFDRDRGATGRVKRGKCSKRSGSLNRWESTRVTTPVGWS